MRITIATGPCFPFPALQGGGMIRTWESLAKLFVQQGHQVTILARHTPDQAREEILQGVRILRQGGFHQHALTPINLVRDFFYALRACPHLPEADILITNDFWLPFFSPRLHASAGRVVVSVNRFPKHQLFLYSKASLLITPSLSLLKEIHKQAPHLAQRSACIPNPFDSEHFHLDPTAIRPPQSILYVGRIHPEKGLHILLQAMAKIYPHFPQASLSIVGPSLAREGGGGSAYLGRLRSLADSLPVTFLPPVYSAEKLAAIYRQHSIFCYPTLADRGEAMGIAPIEAMACGCVPIVSRNPVFSDWLKSGQNGWSFDHHSEHAPAAELAIRLHSLLENPNLWHTMQSSALETE
ncbi:MAG: glycosyltransferase family 4 protein [Blastochloris sp.]|nr:glycosyltransferase family 4 protein [Blastochloris sp.]